MNVILVKHLVLSRLVFVLFFTFISFLTVNLIIKQTEFFREYKCCGSHFNVIENYKYTDTKMFNYCQGISDNISAKDGEECFVGYDMTYYIIYVLAIPISLIFGLLLSKQLIKNKPSE
jgi:hypothetical protein